MFALLPACRHRPTPGHRPSAVSAPKAGSYGCRSAIYLGWINRGHGGHRRRGAGVLGLGWLGLPRVWTVIMMRWPTPLGGSRSSASATWPTIWCWPGPWSHRRAPAGQRAVGQRHRTCDLGADRVAVGCSARRRRPPLEAKRWVNVMNGAAVRLWPRRCSKRHSVQGGRLVGDAFFIPTVDNQHTGGRPPTGCPAQHLPEIRVVVGQGVMAEIQQKVPGRAQ